MHERPIEPPGARAQWQRDATSWIEAAYIVGLCIGAAGLSVLAVTLAPPASEQDPSADVVAHLALVVGICLSGLILASRATTRAKAFGITWLVSLYLVVAAALRLSGSRFGPFGYFLDQSFRTAYVTKLADHLGPVDWGYDGLPWTYPPLYFLSLARVSDVLGIAAWQMIKTGMFAVAFLVPLVTLGLWSRIVGWARAGALAIAALLIQEWYEPYAWLAVALFVPWWLSSWRAERSWRTVPLLGVLGMAVVTLYPYYLGAGMLLWGASFVIRRLPGGRDLRPCDDGAVAGIVGMTVVFSAWWWLPPFVSAVSSRHWSDGPMRYFHAGAVDAPTRFLTFDLIGVLLLGGLVYLAFTARRDRNSLTLLGLGAAAYVWFSLGFAAVLLGVPLLTERMGLLVLWILAVSAVLGAVELWERLHARRPNASLVAATLVVVAVFSLGQQTTDRIPYVKEQQNADYPTELLADYERSTPSRDAVVLTDIYELPVFLPDVWVFNAWRVYYASPLSQYEKRAQLIHKLAQETDSDVVQLVLRHNRYQAVDQVVFRAGTASYSYTTDRFPRPAATRIVVFEATAFDGFNLVRSKTLDVFIVPTNHSYTCRTLVAAKQRYRNHLSPAVEREADTCRQRIRS